MFFLSYSFFLLLREQNYFKLLLLSSFARAKEKEAKRKLAGCTSEATPKGVGLKQKNSLRSNSFCFFTPSLPFSALRLSSEAGNYFTYLCIHICIYSYIYVFMYSRGWLPTMNPEMIAGEDCRECLLWMFPASVGADLCVRPVCRNGGCLRADTQVCPYKWRF